MGKKMAEALTANSEAFGRCYAKLLESLVAAGIPEKDARDEARMTALMVAMAPDTEVQPLDWGKKETASA